MGQGAHFQTDRPRRTDTGTLEDIPPHLVSQEADLGRGAPFKVEHGSHNRALAGGM